MATPAAMTFGEAMARGPMRTFQSVTVAVCMLILISDGIDMQLLGIVAPLVIADFGVDRTSFGIAMSAALVGFGLGAWGGGWLGDRIGRRWTLAISALLFALGTVAASTADGVWSLALWRVISGLGFGAAYANSLAMAGELSTLPRVGNVQATFPVARFRQCNRLSRPPNTTRSLASAGEEKYGKLRSRYVQRFVLFSRSMHKNAFS